MQKQDFLTEIRKRVEQAREGKTLFGDPDTFVGPIAGRMVSKKWILSLVSSIATVRGFSNNFFLLVVIEGGIKYVVGGSHRLQAVVGVIPVRRLPYRKIDLTGITDEEGNISLKDYSTAIVGAIQATESTPKPYTFMDEYSMVSDLWLSFRKYHAKQVAKMRELRLKINYKPDSRSMLKWYKEYHWRSVRIIEEEGSDEQKKKVLKGVDVLGCISLAHRKVLLQAVRIRQMRLNSSQIKYISTLSVSTVEQFIDFIKEEITRPGESLAKPDWKPFTPKNQAIMIEGLSAKRSVLGKRKAAREAEAAIQGLGADMGGSRRPKRRKYRKSITDDEELKSEQEPSFGSEEGDFTDEFTKTSTQPVRKRKAGKGKAVKPAGELRKSADSTKFRAAKMEVREGEYEKEGNGEEEQPKEEGLLLENRMKSSKSRKIPGIARKNRVEDRCCDEEEDVEEQQHQVEEGIPKFSNEGTEDPHGEGKGKGRVLEQQKKEVLPVKFNNSSDPPKKAQVEGAGFAEEGQPEEVGSPAKSIEHGGCVNTGQSEAEDPVTDRSEGEASAQKMTRSHISSDCRHEGAEVFVPEEETGLSKKSSVAMTSPKNGNSDKEELSLQQKKIAKKSKGQQEHLKNDGNVVVEDNIRHSNELKCLPGDKSRFDSKQWMERIIDKNKSIYDEYRRQNSYGVEEFKVLSEPLQRAMKDRRLPTACLDNLVLGSSFRDTIAESRKKCIQLIAKYQERSEMEKHVNETKEEYEEREKVYCRECIFEKAARSILEEYDDGNKWNAPKCCSELIKDLNERCEQWFWRSESDDWKCFITTNEGINRQRTFPFDCVQRIRQMGEMDISDVSLELLWDVIFYGETKHNSGCWMFPLSILAGVFEEPVADLPSRLKTRFKALSIAQKEHMEKVGILHFAICHKKHWFLLSAINLFSNETRGESNDVLVYKFDSLPVVGGDQSVSDKAIEGLLQSLRNELQIKEEMKMVKADVKCERQMEGHSCGFHTIRNALLLSKIGPEVSRTPCIFLDRLHSTMRQVPYTEFMECVENRMDKLALFVQNGGDRISDETFKFVRCLFPEDLDVTPLTRKDSSTFQFDFDSFVFEARRMMNFSELACNEISEDESNVIKAELKGKVDSIALDILTGTDKSVSLLKHLTDIVVEHKGYFK